MSASVRAQAPDARTLIRTLHGLRTLSSTEPGYWDELARSLGLLCRAPVVRLVQKSAGADNAASSWQLLGHSGDEASRLLTEHWQEVIGELSDRAAAKGFATCPGRDASRVGVIFAAIRLERLPGAFALLEIAEQERARLNELLLRAQLVADLPGTPAPPGTSPSAAEVPPQLPSVPVVPTPAAASEALEHLLELVVEVMQQPQLGTATLCLVNGLSATLGASQVAFGWVARGEVHTATISHLDRFDRRSHHVHLIESALGEALEHDETVHYTHSATADGQLFHHRELAKELGFSDICSIALRRGFELPTAAVLLAFDERHPLAPSALARIQFVLGLVMPWLEALRERERSWVQLVAHAATRQLEGLLGPRHAWLKAGGLCLSLFMLYAAFATWEFRVHATGQLSTDSTRVVSANFEGRVETVRVSSGDLVRAGMVLSTLDTRELRQQELDARAEIKRHGAEADKARAAGAWAEVEIASARQMQAEARLARVLDLIEQSVGRAPFDAVVVEGERRELQGAPVRKGDKLFKLARIEGLYAVVQVAERDIPYIAANATGEIVLVSRPDRKIPIRVSSVIPVAQVKGQEGNHFMVRAELLQPPEAWWRPGMTGTVRIDAGRRNVVWILTHRLVDKVRMALWW